MNLIIFWHGTVCLNVKSHLTLCKAENKVRWTKKELLVVLISKTCWFYLWNDWLYKLFLTHQCSTDSLKVTFKTIFFMSCFTVGLLINITSVSIFFCPSILNQQVIIKGRLPASSNTGTGKLVWRYWFCLPARLILLMTWLVVNQNDAASEHLVN